jgi:hypothetical protein
MLINANITQTRCVEYGVIAYRFDDCSKTTRRADLEQAHLSHLRLLGAVLCDLATIQNKINVLPTKAFCIENATILGKTLECRQVHAPK